MSDKEKIKKLQSVIDTLKEEWFWAIMGDDDKIKHYRKVQDIIK